VCGSGLGRRKLVIVCANVSGEEEMAGAAIEELVWL
jgi:hypothetical protein